MPTFFFYIWEKIGQRDSYLPKAPLFIIRDCLSFEALLSSHPWEALSWCSPEGQVRVGRRLLWQSGTLPPDPF